MARQAKDVHQKHQAILSRLLKDDDNKYCVDCDAKGPRWASWNLGVFLCIRCAGIHRNLGVHISKVKSINLDSWTPEQIASVEDMGNSKARAVYEANLPDHYKRPSTTDSAMEQFIRAKYEHKKYIAKEWVPSKPRSVPSHYYDNDEQKKEPKKPVKTILKVPGAAAGTSAVSRPAAEKNTPAPAATAVSKPEQSLMVDLSAPANTGVANSSKPETTSADLLADIFTSAPAPSTAASTDLFGMSTAPQSAAQSTAPQSTGQQSGDASEDLFKVADEKSQTAKDSIMALFGNTPNPQPNMMANSYGMAPGAFAQPTQGMMGVQPQANPAMSASYQYGYQPQMGAAAAPGMGYSMAGQQPNMMTASQPGTYQQYPGMAMGAQATAAGNPAYMQQQMFAQQQMQMSMGNLSLNQQVGNGMATQTTPAASFCNTPVAQTNGQTLNGALWN